MCFPSAYNVKLPFLTILPSDAYTLPNMGALFIFNREWIRKKYIFIIFGVEGLGPNRVSICEFYLQAIFIRRAILRSFDSKIPKPPLNKGLVTMF